MDRSNITVQTSSSTEVNGFSEHRQINVETPVSRGVARIQAFSSFYGVSHPVAITLYLCIFAVSLSFTLDQSTIGAYSVYATGALDHQSYIGVIEIVETIFAAVSKPVLAYIADQFSRQTCYAVILIFNVTGYVIIASAPNAVVLCIGRVLAAPGRAGFDLITITIVSDLSPLQWRGFMTTMIAFPYLFLPFAGAKIQASLCSGKTTTCWRWGFGMYCIIAPVLVSPIIITLCYADRRIKRWRNEGISSRNRLSGDTDTDGVAIRRATTKHRATSLTEFLQHADVVGLVFLGFGFAPILLPFSLVREAKHGWANPSMIAMLACGSVSLVAFVVWESFFTKHPVLKRRLWTNKVFLCAVLLDISFMMSEQVRNTYHSTWVFVIKPWSEYEWGKFTIIGIVGTAFFGLLAGMYQRVSHRYKTLQISGCCIRTLSLGLTYWAVGSNATTAALVITQMMNVLGGAWSSVGTRVASQASVAHADLAALVAQLSLWTRLGGSVGSTIATSLYTNSYKHYLAQEGLTAEQIDLFYSSGTKSREKYPWDNPVRQAGIRAFTHMIRRMFLISLCLSFIPFLLSLAMPNYFLGKAHNTVDDPAAKPAKVPRRSGSESILD